MTSLVDLRRSTYMTVGGPVKKPALDYLSARYKNLRFLVEPTNIYVVTSADEANLFGIAFSVYGDRDYWWVLGVYNGILDPIGGVYPGLTLQIPNLSKVNALLSSTTINQLLEVVV